MGELAANGSLHQENAFRALSSETEKHPVAQRLFQEYSIRRVPGRHTAVIRLKRDRLCHSLLSYIRLLSQYQRAEFEGLKAPLKKQK